MPTAPPPAPRRAIYGPLLHGRGELHIVDIDRVTSVADPDGTLRRLVVLADGSRDVHELYAALARDRPGLAVDEVVSAVRRLTTAGVLEQS